SVKARLGQVDIEQITPCEGRPLQVHPIEVRAFEVNPMQVQLQPVAGPCALLCLDPVAVLAPEKKMGSELGDDRFVYYSFASPVFFRTRLMCVLAEIRAQGVRDRFAFCLHPGGGDSYPLSAV